MDILNVPSPREAALLPGILSKRVTQDGSIECGHSQGVNFVARHSLKACKHLESSNVGTPRDSILLPDVL